MNRYYYSFWIKLLDFYPVNRIAWDLVARSYRYVHSRPKLYRLWDRLFSDVFYLWSARVKSLCQTDDESEGDSTRRRKRGAGR